MFGRKCSAFSNPQLAARSLDSASGFRVGDSADWME
jgi:hypothetical protein